MRVVSVTEFWRNFCPHLKGEFVEVARKVVSYSFLTRPDKGEYLNILLVGDSSTGKSEILRGASKFLEFCQFVSTSTTSAGLAFDARWKGKEGLAVRNQGGFLMIDEFDKQSTEVYKVLLEIMDKHTITITKGRHRKILDAKVNVIAAANPRNFRWEFLTVDEIPIPLVLLTRFHLIIPLGSLDSKYYPDVAENFSDEAKSKFEDSMKGFKEFVERCREMDVVISKKMSKYAGVFFQKMKEKGLDEY